MIVSINQPAYLPWLGYFHRIAVSDLHIVLDDVQFEKNSFTNRNKIRTREGWQWLTVPVKTKGKFGDLAINELEPDNHSRWAAKHWTALRQHYGKAPFFKIYEPQLAEIYAKPWERLNDLMRVLTTMLLEAFSIRTPLRYSSDMKVDGAKDELVLNLCRAANATHYLSGPLGRNYLREEIFAAAGVKVSYNDYRHPAYAQVYPGFEPFMAALDLLFNCGPDSLAILKKDQIPLNV